MYEEETKVLKKAVAFLKKEGQLKKGAMVVLGCSTSEVAGGRIGKASVPELGRALAEAMINACRENELVPAFQCCEHLNRALVMEQAELDKRNLTQVMVVPYPHAGGSVGSAAYRQMCEPAVAMHVQADAVIDIGDTLVGMHIRPVAVPVRMEEKQVGQAHLVMAYSRLPLIGGERAHYRLGDE